MFKYYNDRYNSLNLYPCTIYEGNAQAPHQAFIRLNDWGLRNYVIYSVGVRLQCMISRPDENTECITLTSMMIVFI